MKHTTRAVLGGAGFAALTLVGVDAAAQSPAPAPGYPQGYPPSYPAPAQPSYPAPAQPSYPAPAQPSYPAPAQPSYPAPAQPSYPAPAQPSYPAPAQPSYPAPAQPSYPAPAQPSYPAPAPGYPAQAPGYPPPAAAPAPGYPTQTTGYPVQGYGAPATAAAVAAGAPWFQSGYVHVGGILGFHGWGSSHASMGSFSSDTTLKGKFLGGVSLSAYYVSSPGVQIGGYFNFGNGKINDGDTDQYSLGLSLKAGSRVAERVWLGFAGDLGFYALDSSLSKAWYGVEISPRIHLDVLGLDAGGFKMGFFASFGPSVVPYAAGSVGGADVRSYLIYLTMRLGVTFGS
jgi:hypothetical protein